MPVYISIFIVVHSDCTHAIQLLLINKYCLQCIHSSTPLLMLCTGIDSACSRYSCIWCKCPSEERYDSHKEWSLTDKEKGARTVEENTETATLRRGKKQFNVSHPPLFPGIPLKNVVIDNLHLFLRVSDVLINLLVVELKRQDGIERVKKMTAFDPEHFSHINAFQVFVTSLGIPDLNFYIDKSSKELKCRSLTGPEKLKVLRRICIVGLLPRFETTEAEKIQFLWDELLQLNFIFSKPARELSLADIDIFESRARTWVRKFIDVYHEKNITPYIHALMNHVPEFMRIHSSILPFTQQGLEKYNDIMTKQYFRSSNHKSEQALVQIMEKQNRLEYLRDQGVQPAKCFEVVCSKCGHTGHNQRTCSADAVTNVENSLPHE